MSYTNGLDNPELYFQIKTYTGDGESSRAVTLDGDEDMQVNLIWIKERSSTSQPQLADTVRGYDKRLQPDSSDAEDDDSSPFYDFKSLDSNGWTMGNGGAINEDTQTYVAWCWKASGSTASNTNGTNITSTVDANTTSGFSIVSWTGDNSGSSTVGHGLGKTAEFVVIKNRADSANWQVKHKNNSANASQSLDVNDAESSRAGSTNGGIADLSGTTTFGFIAGSAGVPAANGDSDAMIAYVWNSVQGYSKFGTYTGNNNADGTFLYLGFRPAYLMVKKIDGTDNWTILDKGRSPFNPVDDQLYADLNAAEADANVCDFLSNGVKFRGNGGSYNGNGNDYIYMAFAEQPFVNSEGVPCNAK